MRRGPQRRERQGQGPAKRPVPAKALEPVLPLRGVVAACEAALAGLGERPESGVVREFWREWEARHGGRADFGLWRRLRGAVVFRGRLNEVVEPALRALRGEDVEVRWAALALLPAIPLEARSGPLKEAVRGALRGGVPVNAPRSVAWVRWLAEAWLGEESLAGVRGVFEAMMPAWRPGRALELTALEAEAWLPVDLGLARRWAASALARRVRMGEGVEKASAWLLTAWQLLRDARSAGAGAGAGEVEMLLQAAGWLRVEGQGMEAVRLTALALELAPERLSDRLQRRGHVAAWAVAEAGLWVAERWQARLETMPFPGDPPHSERGQEAARHFADEEDPGRALLEQEVATEADWQVLREAGLETQQALPMLAWVARKAQAHAVKKQYELLSATTRLALRHGCLVSAGKLLAVWPGQAERVLELARRWRASWRQMPVLRDAAAWEEALGYLRAAWGRLDLEAFTEEEDVFFLHETLGGERELATRLRLPEPLLAPTTTEVALALRADPRLLSVLEHQRAAELWEIKALARREDLNGVAWASVVAAGEAGSGRFSVLMVGPGGAWSRRVRLERGEPAVWMPGLLAVLTEGARAVMGGVEPERWLLCLDATLPTTGWSGLKGAVVVPSWESAFRSLREQPLAALLTATGSGWKSLN